MPDHRSTLHQRLRGRDRFLPPLTMLTCYDALFARILAEAGIDLLLVGDSVANVLLGHPRTAQVGLRDLVHHVEAVRRGAPDADVVADLPWESSGSPEAARSGARILREAGADAVKLEGADPRCVDAVASETVLVGHLGLLPQTAQRLGQVGRTEAEADSLLEQAKLLDDQGAAALVLEHIPADLALRITAEITCPTIGIGAGPGCRGQVLVLHDLLGLTPPPRPPFVKARADLRNAVREAVESWRQDVLADGGVCRENG